MSETLKTCAVEIIDFAPEYLDEFKAINIAWIEKYFKTEPEDYHTLDTPYEHVIKPGGAILLAKLNGEIVGTAALRKHGDSLFHLEKMGVREDVQGLKVGLKLSEAIIERARQLGAEKIYLESNTKLKPALSLYKKLGFKEVPYGTSPFSRVDIAMELKLGSGAEIIEYDERYLSDFQNISREWIESSYWLEEVDRPILSDPEKHVIRPGGVILMAKLDGEIVGTVALCKDSKTICRIRKLGVYEKARGRGIGRQLVEAIMLEAKKLGAEKIVLETGTKLDAAIRLYEALGFTHMELISSADCRCDVRMEYDMRP